MNRATGNLNIARLSIGEAAGNRTRKRKWRHPWFTQAVYEPSEQSWFATVKAGFVNARAPKVRTLVTEKEQRGDPSFGVNPLTGKLYFSEFVFENRNTAAGRSVTLDIPLYVSPAIPLQWRAIGSDGTPLEEVPEFFRNLGVRPAKALTEESIFEQQTEEAEPPGGLRLLRACDIILHQPRLALTSEITIEAGVATGISLATQTLGLRSPATDDTLRIFAGNYVAASSAPIDPLAGVYEEPTWDELLLATVFLLSPPHTAAGSEPDGTWTPFVAHRRFWNLQYVPARFRGPTIDQGIPFIPPLAAGAAQPVINGYTAWLNDRTQEALNILAARSMRGTFYSITGGGSDAAFPVAADLLQERSSGLGKDGSAPGKAARRAAAARAKRAAKLDPEFPFSADAFDPALLEA